MMGDQGTKVEHKRQAEGLPAIDVAIVTVSDTRTHETDVNGIYLKQVLPDAGCRVAGYRIIPDEPELIVKALEDFSSANAQAILFNGGTGFSKRDCTFDTLSRQLEKTLPGFGELFRMLSYEQVGSAAMLSRAVAGLFRNCLVFSTPGSPKAVALAWEKLIAPELKHLVWEINR